MTNHLTRPDTSLPFFVFDIFDPQESLLSDILEITDISENENLVEKIVPITIKDVNERKRQAYLIYFNENYRDDAYDIICKSKSRYSNEWKQSEISNIKFNAIIRKDRRNNSENNYMELPNINLPFFTYGVFKKGQIAHSRIKRYICKEIENEKIPYKMGVRDGIPILFYEKPGTTHGNLIQFNENDQKKAYKLISNTKFKEFCKWKEIKVNGQPANVIVAKDDRGISDIIYSKSYDGSDDIFFTNAIDYIEEQLTSVDGETMENFLNLQMLYLLLWVAIERFCILKYGLDDIYKNRQKFASNEDKFSHFLKEIKRNNETIFSAKNFNEYLLDKKDPCSSIEYYYAIRCNVAHRGKIPSVVDFNSFFVLESSLNELLYIFKQVLNDSFDGKLFEFDD